MQVVGNNQHWPLKEKSGYEIEKYCERRCNLRLATRVLVHFGKALEQDRQVVVVACELVWRALADLDDEWPLVATLDADELAGPEGLALEAV